MAYTDKTLTCSDCGMTFVFTAGEQEFYASRGLTPPRRCRSCREARRRERERAPAGARRGDDDDDKDV